jgi:hypothetical protein
LSPSGGKKEHNMAIYKATYWNVRRDHVRDGFPWIFWIYLIDDKDEGSWVNFILPDDAKVKLLTQPFAMARPLEPDDLIKPLIGLEMEWGELRKKLYIKDHWAVPEDFDVEVSDFEWWLCNLPTIKARVEKLRDKIRRRNRLIEELREKLKEDDLVTRG